jgi:acyl-coenzyme A synthetase/AMP-(fatty) acid ligase
VGARLVIAKSGGHQDSRYLADLAASERTTVLHFVPSLLEGFVDADGPAQCSSLRLVICSGEALPASLVERFRSQTPAALHNLYGPTEASIEISSWDCRDSQTGEAIPIGAPIANTELLILDAAGEPAPVGVSGELYLGGIGIARGYVERPALTAERFVPDSFSGRRGSRLYRTGDRARYREDGAVEYLGRLDGQAKIRGVRIELGEIEAVLRGHAKVREAAVKTWSAPGLGQLLIAYIVPFAAGPEDSRLPEELRSYLRRSLPLSMIPSMFISIAAMPVNASGKLDRQALPLPQLPANSGLSYTGPRSPLEELLTGIVESVLNRRPLGVHDNFFEFGGNSLSAIKVQARINSQYSLDLPLAALFESPTIESMARSIGNLQSQQTDPAELAALLDEIEALTEKDEH